MEDEVYGLVSPLEFYQDCRAQQCDRFFVGIFTAYYVARLPGWVKGILDVIFTLPMVLPPTVCGYFLLMIFGVHRPVGEWLAKLGIQAVMTWYGGILASAVVAFPLMYRTARGL